MERVTIKTYKNKIKKIKREKSHKKKLKKCVEIISKGQKVGLKKRFNKLHFKRYLKREM